MDAGGGHRRRLGGDGALLAVAASVCALVVTQAALAGSSGGGAVSAGVSAKLIKKVKWQGRQLMALRARVAALEQAPGPEPGAVGPDSVGSPEVIDESLGAADLGPGSVGASEVFDASLGAAELGADSVGSSEVIDDSLGGDDVDEASLDPLVMQRRVGSSCSTGAIAQIFSNGLVGCNPGNLGSSVGLDNDGCDPTFAAPTLDCASVTLNVTKLKTVLILAAGVSQAIQYDDPANGSDDANSVGGFCRIHQGATPLNTSNTASLNQVAATGQPSPGSNNFAMIATDQIFSLGSRTYSLRCTESDGNLILGVTNLAVIDLATQ